MDLSNDHGSPMGAVYSTPSYSKNVRRYIHSVMTKKYGFTLQVEAMKYLEQVFLDYQIPSEDWIATLELIAQAYRSQEAGHRLPIVSKEELQIIITRLEHHSTPSNTPYSTQNTQEGDETLATTLALEEVQLPQLVHVIHAFEQPKWKYNQESKTFNRVESPNPLHGTAESKALIYRERYDLIKQRVFRNQNFRPASSFYSNQSDRFFTLTPISSLRGRTNESFVLFGMLCKYEDEKLYLEDPTGHVELDISKAARSRGFFTETCFVVLDGIYTEDSIFIVKAMAMPPAESRVGTIEVFGQLDFLGASLHEIYDRDHLKRIEEKYDNVSIVFLSNVYLDVPQVMSALRKLLAGCEESLMPLSMVFCGNFSSRTLPAAAYQRHWTHFIDLLASFPALAASTTFVFVPGPTDPMLSPGLLLPRPPLPRAVTQRLRRKLTHVHAASNPCRIAYCSQEIVVFRENVLTKLLRNTVVLGEGKDVQGMPYHLARTLVDQAHMCPLPLHTSPVLWDYEHALRLYPLPSLLVLADSAEKFHEVYEHVHIVNPGSFSTSSGFGFLVYYPQGQRVEMSCLGED